MRVIYAVLVAMVVAMFIVLTSPILLLAQSFQPGLSVSVPRLINISGVFQPVDGQSPAPAESVTLSIYAEPEGGTPLWQETQVVAVDKAGRFTVLMGATRAEGIPPEVFASGEAQWMSMLVARAGEVERPRVRIASVPYALRASDAETLGGLPAAAYLLAPSAGAPTASERDRAANPGSVSGAKGSSVATAEPPVGMTNAVLAGSTNFIAKYVNSGADVGNSSVYEAGGSVGIGTTAPLDSLHVRFTNTVGAMTGLAVQNMGNTTASYSGMMFYDQNGALGQFQGFNNVTHEYRINNVARNGSSVLDGSINFMTGSKSRFLVTTNGNIGIGTAAPVALLEVSNALPGGPANVWVTSYTNASGPYYLARRARGTPSAPTAVLNGDGLSGLWGGGYGTTAFGNFTGGITVQAAQNWTDTAQGTALTFMTTSIDSNSPVTRMTLDATGNLGIGTTTVPAAGLLEVSNASNSSTTGTLVATTFANAAGSLFVGSRARGTSGAPAAVQNGDTLVGFLGRGFGATGFSATRGGMFVRAAENWTNTAQGTSLNFNTTTNGTIAPATRMTIDSIGNVGLGTTGPGAALDMVRETGSGPLEIALTRYAGTSSSGEPNIVLRTARGSRAAPSAVQAGDELGGLGATGYGATDFGNVNVGLGGIAVENWTDTAQGAALIFGATPLGSNEGEVNMVIMPGGNVAIGAFTQLPTITDKLEVSGDIRVGTAGTNGCLKDFSGGALAGTCASDRRFKKDITPFGKVLGPLTALRPVNYFWRAADFPEHHFGDSRASGLIAQEVEQVLPELVVTGDDGYKAVNYSKLPLLTIQAVKELKEENDALKQRVAELERMFAEMMATAARR